MAEQERGQVKRISFEILYPTGQLKQVHVPIGGVEAWEGASLIVWDERTLDEVVLPGLEAAHGSAVASDARAKWDTVDGQFKPAMLVVKEDGLTIGFCGNHVKLGGSALWPDEVPATAEVAVHR